MGGNEGKGEKGGLGPLALYPIPGKISVRCWLCLTIYFVVH